MNRGIEPEQVCYSKDGFSLFFCQLWNAFDPASTVFVANVAAGIAILLVEIFIVFIILTLCLGKYLDYLQKKREKATWNKTRQALAFAMLVSLRRVTKHSNNMVVVLDGEGGRIVLSNWPELHILKLETALANFNEQIIVHLPAFLPPISENFSEISREISDLQETAAALRYHLDILSKKNQIDNYDPDCPARSWVDKDLFECNGGGAMNLKKDAEPTDKNFFVMTLIEHYNRLLKLSDNIKKYVEYVEHNHGHWDGFDEKKVESANAVRKEQEEDIKSAKDLKAQIQERGLYLVLYTKPSPDTYDI